MADEVVPGALADWCLARLAGDDRIAIAAAHAAAIAADEPGYADPATGLFVFTAAYLVQRGRCCDSSCRHCPYIE